MRNFFIFSFLVSSCALLAAPFAYVTDPSDDTVKVIDLATKNIVAIIPVGDLPIDVVITPDGTKVYVTNNVDSTVSVIDTTINTVIATVAVGPNPTGAAVTHDGRTVWVADNGGTTITPIDTATNTAGTPIMGFNNPNDIAISPDDTTAYVTNVGDNSVIPVNLITGTLGTPISVGLVPDNIVITPNGRKVYVANSNDATISVIDTVTNTVIETIVLPDDPLYLAISFDGKRLYASLGDDMVVIDTITDTIIATVSIEDPDGLAFFPCGQPLFIASSNEDAIFPLDVVTNTLGTPFAAGSATNLAITPIFDVRANIIKNVFLNRVEFVAQLNWDICPPTTAAFYRIFINGVAAGQVFAGSPSEFVICLPLQFQCSALELGLFAANGVEITRLPVNVTLNLRKLAKC